MAKKVARFKQRTREHVIADLSVHHVEGFVLLEGHTVQVVTRYGYDLLMFTYDRNGYVEPGFLFVQLKAAETLQSVGSDYVFDLDVRDYHLWMLEQSPVILILYDASHRQAYWLHTQQLLPRPICAPPKEGGEDEKCVRNSESPDGDSQGHLRHAGTQANRPVAGGGRRAMNQTDATYRRTHVTYGQLNRALSLLGVSRRQVKDNPAANVYEHSETGPIIVLPAYPESDRVLDYHLAALRTLLDNFGIADPSSIRCRTSEMSGMNGGHNDEPRSPDDTTSTFPIGFGRSSTNHAPNHEAARKLIGGLTQQQMVHFYHAYREATDELCYDGYDEERWEHENEYYYACCWVVNQR